ncbi:DUF58 domain-containing protein [Chitinophagaceae bacterium MMS25-I14]
MKQLRKYIGDLFLTTRWYLLMGSSALFFVLAFFNESLFPGAVAYVLFLLVLTLADYLLLFAVKGNIKTVRNMPARFSLGDDNNVILSLLNSYPFEAIITIIDELPVQFQFRDFQRDIKIAPGSRQTFPYSLKPTERGEYHFGYVVCFVKSPVRLLQRRFKTSGETTVKVYPSFQQLKKYQLMAMSNNQYAGIKKIRRLGHSLEFEKIKEYTPGDDIRTINWNATARRDAVMVNTYTDTRQQQIYCVIDEGRAMKMPFDGMTLLDYSINASLALMNIALLRQDRAGLISFSGKHNDMIPAERRNGQIITLTEALYRQQTGFMESDYESLWRSIYQRINQRSFMLLFTNFETVASLERQLPYLRHIASRHLLCVVFFQNTLLKEITESSPDNTEGIYIKTIAGQFDFEKKQIVKELRRHGIISILTTPQQLTVDVINKYLELKARQAI